jgi:imidazolonepropionase-like amidohydrolase
LLLMLAMAGCATAKAPGGSAAPEPSFAIRNVRIFDGEKVISSGTVVVQGERIAAVGEDADLSHVTEIIDGQGQTLLPGLIDAHFHPNGPEAYGSALAFGVTTVIDMFGQYSASVTKTSLGAVSTRKDDEADAVVSLLITAPGGHGAEYPNVVTSTATSPQECQAAVNAQSSAGVSFIKLIYDAGESWSPKAVPALSREVLASCIEAAHARGLLAIVHTLTLREARESIEAGADGLAHGIVDTPPSPDFARRVAERGAFVIPTLAAISGAARHRNDEKLLKDPRIEAYLSPNSLSNLKTSIPDGFMLGMKPSVNQEALRQLKAAGVPILAGSDCANPQTAVGATLHQELELLVASGFTPAEALAAATSLPSARFRLRDRGRIAPGLRADLLLVRGDPTADILATRDIAAVWKRGKKLERAAYRARAPGGAAGAMKH